MENCKNQIIMFNRISLVLAVLVAVVWAESCSSGKKDFNVDVSSIRADVEVVRFDLDFDTINPRNVYSALPAMTGKYGDFMELYMRGIIGLPAVEEAGFQMSFDDFMNYCKVNSVFRDVEKAYPAGEDLAPLFEDGFRHFRYYFPSESLPRIYTVVAGFNESVFPTDDIVAFALEKYLGGDDYQPYYGLPIESYQRRRMVKAMMPVDFFTTYALLNYPKSDDNADNLLTEMIYQGRVQYFLKSMFPSEPDSLLWGYTDVNYRWAEYYEEDVWNYLIDRKLLFETDKHAITALTGEARFTNAFGNESAPRAATFCGYGIVCSYMMNHPEVSLKDLMEMTDMQSIYNMSRYNP